MLDDARRDPQEVQDGRHRLRPRDPLPARREAGRHEPDRDPLGRDRRSIPRRSSATTTGGATATCKGDARRSRRRLLTPIQERYRELRADPDRAAAPARASAPTRRARPPAPTLRRGLRAHGLRRARSSSGATSSPRLAGVVHGRSRSRQRSGLRCSRFTRCPTASNMRFTWRLRPSWIVSSITAPAEAPHLRGRGLGRRRRALRRRRACARMPSVGSLPDARRRRPCRLRTAGARAGARARRRSSAASPRSYRRRGGRRGRRARDGRRDRRRSGGPAGRSPSSPRQPGLCRST